MTNKEFAVDCAGRIIEYLEESESFYIEDDMTAEFIESIITDEKHQAKIIEFMSEQILKDLEDNPDAFQKDESGEFQYDFDMVEDYGGYPTVYIREIFYEGQTRKLRLCKHCGSDNVEMRAWVKPNKGNKFTDYVSDQEADDNYCLDCQQHGELLDSEIKYTAEVEGFQVVGIDGTDKEGDIHPDMGGSFCIYSLSQAREMIAKNPNEWRLLTLWSGDVEEPTYMFEGDPRG